MRNPLEGDVVVRRGAAAAADGRGGEVACVDRDVGAGGEAVAVATALAAAAKELDGVGDDVDQLAVLAGLLVLPDTPLEETVDPDTAALREVSRAVLALRAPHGDVEVVGEVAPLAALAVLAAGVDRDAQLADGGPAGERAQLRVGGQVAGDDHPVDVRAGHRRGSFRERTEGLGESRPGV